MRTGIALCVCLLAALSSARELKQIIFTHRHGDRTSLTLIPNDHVDWVSTLGVRGGQMTTLGYQQAYDLGLWIREEYMEKIKLIKPNYDPLAVYARSTNHPRTITTANLVLAAVFNNNTKYDDISLNTISITAAVPVTMVNWPDEILRGYECPLFKSSIIPALVASQEWQDKEAEEAEWLEFFFNVTGFENEGLVNFYDYYDPINVQNTHNLLNLPALNPYIEKITDLADWSESMKFRAGGKYIGGTFVKRVYDDMKAMISGSSSAYSYVQYSAHDSSLQALLSGLELDQAPMFVSIPRYASALVFELWREDDNSYSVNLRYRDGINGTVQTVHTYTSFSQFEAVAARRGMTSATWCSVCATSWDPATAPVSCIQAQCATPVPKPVPTDDDDDDDDDGGSNDEDKLRAGLAVVGALWAVTVLALGFVTFRMCSKNSSNRAKIPV